MDTLGSDITAYYNNSANILVVTTAPSTRITKNLAGSVAIKTLVKRRPWAVGSSNKLIIILSTQYQLYLHV